MIINFHVRICKSFKLLTGECGEKLYIKFFNWSKKNTDRIKKNFKFLFKSFLPITEIYKIKHFMSYLFELYTVRFLK